MAGQIGLGHEAAALLRQAIEACEGNWGTLGRIPPLPRDEVEKMLRAVQEMVTALGNLLDHAEHQWLPDRYAVAAVVAVDLKRSFDEGEALLERALETSGVVGAQDAEIAFDSHVGDVPHQLLSKFLILARMPEERR